MRRTMIATSELKQVMPNFFKAKISINTLHRPSLQVQKLSSTYYIISHRLSHNSHCKLPINQCAMDEGLASVDLDDLRFDPFLSSQCT
jgi:hypothetical protein